MVVVVINVLSLITNNANANANGANNIYKIFHTTMNKTHRSRKAQNKCILSVNLFFSSFPLYFPLFMALYVVFSIWYLYNSLLWMCAKTVQTNGETIFFSSVFFFVDF